MRASRTLVPLAVLLLGSACAPRFRAGTDCHMHIAPKARDAAGAAAALREAGLRRGCLLSPGYVWPEGCKTAPCAGQREWTAHANDWTLAQARSVRGALPFCAILLGVPWAEEEVARCAAGGARGLKLHPMSQELSIRRPDVAAQLDAIARAAAPARLPVLIHIRFDETEADALYALARAHPETAFIAAHQLGPEFRTLKRAPSNVFVDISGLVHAPLEAGPYFVGTWREIGMDRILLGSDWPELSLEKHLAALEAFPLTRKERRMITTDNAKRLFR